ncbi:MAG TPA: hypothetical protein VGJ04_03530 [Pirellulales bacterium]|jgi:hypothetical protein
MMDTRALFGISVLMGFVAFGLVTAIYIWPRLVFVDRNSALRGLVAPHAFRFIGLSFLVPGVVSGGLPRTFAAPAAYGDLIAAILAVAAVIALTRRVAWATLLVWIFNVWGTADLLLAFVHGAQVRLDAEMLGAAFFIPTVVVPGLLITHGMIFWLLVHGKNTSKVAS